MGRENQGLQIALIIFVMLTVVLGVTTFVFYRKCDETLASEKASKQEADEQRTATGNAKTETDQMRNMMGLSGKALSDVRDEFKKDMEKYAANFPEDARFYSPMAAYLWDTVDARLTGSKSTQIALADLKRRYVGRQGTKDQQLGEIQKVLRQAEEDRKKAEKLFELEGARIAEDQGLLAKGAAEVRKNQADIVTGVESKIETVQRKLQVAIKESEAKTKALEKIARQAPEIPSGEVTWSDERAGIVWINLGRADGLQPRTTFSVYPVNVAEMSTTTKKASIEVTRIDGDHSAQARVLDDKSSDPILLGDKVFTPLWSAGERTHFALVGIMDLNGDGENAVVALRALIAASGGIIDAEADEKGKRTGELTKDTRYLIVGLEPKAEGLTAYSRMINDAERAGIRRLPLAELKEKMGYKRQVGVESFGRTTTRNDVRAKPAVKPAADDSEAAPKPARPAAKPAAKAAAPAADDNPF